MSFGSGEPIKAHHAARFAAIKQVGCLACWLRLGMRIDPDVHHLLSGGMRRGHRYTIGLCDWHHRGYPPERYSKNSATRVFGPALSNGSKPFQEAFGDDQSLLEFQDTALRRAGFDQERIFDE